MSSRVTVPVVAERADARDDVLAADDAMVAAVLRVVVLLVVERAVGTVVRVAVDDAVVRDTTLPVLRAVAAVLVVRCVTPGVRVCVVFVVRLRTFCDVFV